jgi:hypothetical protein
MDGQQQLLNGRRSVQPIIVDSAHQNTQSTHATITDRQQLLVWIKHLLPSGRMNHALSGYMSHSCLDFLLAIYLF